MALVKQQTCLSLDHAQAQAPPYLLARHASQLEVLQRCGPLEPLSKRIPYGPLVRVLTFSEGIFRTCLFMQVLYHGLVRILSHRAHTKRSEDLPWTQYSREGAQATWGHPTYWAQNHLRGYSDSSSLRWGSPFFELSEGGRGRGAATPKPTLQRSSEAGPLTWQPAKVDLFVGFWWGLFYWAPFCRLYVIGIKGFQIRGPYYLGFSSYPPLCYPPSGSPIISFNQP